jgi:predicted secreted Zn-dependent protease
MKCTRDFLFLAGLLVSACSPAPDLQTAQLQYTYAKKGEEMAPMVKRVEQRNPQQGTTQHLSTTNAPIRK